MTENRSVTESGDESPSTPVVPQESVNPTDPSPREEAGPEEAGGLLDWKDVVDPAEEHPFPVDVSVPLVVEVFLPDEPHDLPVSRSNRPPGPRLLEACCWAGGFLAAQIGCTIVAVIVMVMWNAISQTANGKPVNPQELMQADNLPLLEVMVGMDLLFVPLTIAAAALRLYPAPAARLGLQPPSAIHLGLTALITLPLSAICSMLYVAFDVVWQLLVNQFPALSGMNELSSVEMVRQMAESTSLPVLILVIALAPALSEEVIFRGVIGRGLVARRGIAAGVLITSVLFAIVHIHPVHVLAVIPMGIVLHLLHLHTRSLWAPVLLHFLNNSWSSFASKYPELTGDAGDEQQLSWSLITVSAILVLSLLWLLHQTRIRYVLPDETTWNPGYVTPETPPPELDARRAAHRPTVAALFCAGLSLCLFVGLILLG